MQDNRRYFVTGIGTEIGKTVVSAVLVEKLKADYWKPVQSGDLDNTDSMKVQNLISNTTSRIFTETYRLTQPFSPHKSADLDGILIEPNKFNVPVTENNLIIEGAGGLMVPLNNKFLMLDLIKQLEAEVILVSKNYLGSINHTLLTISVLKQNSIPVRGIIFNGKVDKYSQDYILQYSCLEFLGQVPEYDIIDKKAIIAAGHYIAL